MARIIEIPQIMIMVKIVLPFILLVFINLRIKKAKEYQLIKSNAIISFALIIYSIVNALHIFWFIALSFIN